MKQLTKHQTPNINWQLTKFLTVLIILFLFVTACEQEENIFIQNEQITQNKYGLKVNRVSFDELKKDELLKDKISIISNVFDINKMKSIVNKDIYSKDSSFTVLTEKIIKVTTDTTVTYSFKIKEVTKPSSEFENFVIEIINDELKYSIYRYERYDTSELFPYKIFRLSVNEDQINVGYFNDLLPYVIQIGGNCYEVIDFMSSRDFESNTILIPTGCGSGSTSESNSGNTGSNTSGSSSNTSSGSYTGSNTGGYTGSGTDVGEESSGGGGNTSGTNNSDGAPTGVNAPCDDPLHGCDHDYIYIDDQIIVTPELETDYVCQSNIIKTAFVKTAPLSQLVLDIFDGEKSDYNLVFDVNILLEKTPIQGETEPTFVDSNWNLGKLDIEIGLSPVLLKNGTDLALATTAIHESVHAILIYAMETNKITIENTDVSDDHILFQLVNKFLRKIIIKNEFGNVDPNDAKKVEELMHQYMTGLIEDIATSISEFGKSKGYDIPFSYYKKLASLGLEENIKYYMMLDDVLDQDEEQELADIHETLLDEF